MADVIPAESDKWARQREGAAAFAALSGVVHEVGRSIVIFAHPSKVAMFEAEAKFFACGDAERLARMRKGKPYGVAFVAVRSKDASLGSGTVEVLKPYLLPAPYHQVADVKPLLRKRKDLAPARASDIAFVTGRHDVGELLPWANRARLLRLLEGRCACCGATSYPDLLVNAAAPIGRGRATKTVTDESAMEALAL